MPARTSARTPVRPIPSSTPTARKAGPRAVPVAPEPSPSVPPARARKAPGNTAPPSSASSGNRARKAAAPVSPAADVRGDAIPLPALSDLGLPTPQVKTIAKLVAAMGERSAAIKDLTEAQDADKEQLHDMLRQHLDPGSGVIVGDYRTRRVVSTRETLSKAKLLENGVTAEQISKSSTPSTSDYIKITRIGEKE